MISLNAVFAGNLTSLLPEDNLTSAAVSSMKVALPRVKPLAKSAITDEKPVVSTLQSISPPITDNLPTVASNIRAERPDLLGRLGQVELPDTLEFGDLGRVEVKILNRGNAIAQGPVEVELWLSTDHKLDPNDVLLTTKVANLKLDAGQSTSLSLEYENITSAVAPGAYFLITDIDSTNQIQERSETNNLTSQLFSAPGTDIVIDWNAIALNAIQAEGVAGRGIPPTSGSRLLALLSTAVYDTVNAFTGTGSAYAVDRLAPAHASLEAAVAGAAHEILKTLIPKQTYAFGQQLVASLREIEDKPTNEKAGVEFGRAIARDILALRTNDGFDNDAPYVPPTGDFIWQPHAPKYTAVGANWGKVKLFAIPSTADFAPNGLDCAPSINPVVYAQEIEEVRLVGGRNNTALTTIDRTADQTEIAIFWAYDRADTFRPYGQLNQISQEIAIREGNSILENARLFAALNVAIADAAIVAWEAKYKYMQPRPDDVIAGGIAANDGIASTVGDPNWQPLLDTPPFPDYISGHSIFGGAWAGVMNHFFGENYKFTAVSQELPGVTRNFDRFYDAALENALSRIYGGVHTREATVTDSLPTGLEIGQFVAENFFH